MTDQEKDKLQSAASAAADIQRWLLSVAMDGKCSRDRQSDIINASKRIAMLIGDFNALSIRKEET